MPRCLQFWSSSSGPSPTASSQCGSGWGAVRWQETRLRDAVTRAKFQSTSTCTAASSEQPNIKDDRGHGPDRHQGHLHMDSGFGAR